MIKNITQHLKLIMELMASIFLIMEHFNGKYYNMDFWKLGHFYKYSIQCFGMPSKTLIFAIFNWFINPSRVLI